MEKMVRKEELQFKSLDDKIKGTLFLPDSPSNNSPASLLPAVILCHGAIDYKEHFFEFAEFLAKSGYAALAMDMHGHGESEGARYHVRMQQWVPDILAGVEFLSLHELIDESRIGAVGFSSGGTAVLEAAIQQDSFKHQGPLKALVTLDATVKTIINPVETVVFKAISSLGRVKRKLVGRDIKIPLYDLAVKVPASCNPEVNDTIHQDPYFEEAYKAYPLPGAVESLIVDTIKRVDKITIPVCVIHGEEDKVDSPDTARELYKKLKSKKALHIIHQSGHMGHLDYQKNTIQSIAKSWFDSCL